MLVRLAGLFAVLFGSFYLSEGAHWLSQFASGATRRDLFWSHYQTAVIFFDLFAGGGLVLAGVGMSFQREWGRRAWLAMLGATVFLHLLMTFANHAAGIELGHSRGWVAAVVLLSLASWALLTRPAARTRFR